jgi:uncharacterized protein (DUF1015 family)
VATVSGFSALLYDTERAGDLANLVAPPYDVLDDRRRYIYRARSPYNIVALTLPDSPQEAGKTLREWRESGILVEDASALWWIVEDYTGPDGVERTREGIAGSIEVTPYSDGQVLPHEATHSEAKEGRLRILRETRTQLEPILLLYDGDPPVGRPDRDPDLDVELAGDRTRMWRLPETELSIDGPLVIADGHHRYETAVNFRQEEPSATHTFAVLVSSRDPGIEIFPTHRVAQEVGVNPFGMMCSTWDPDALTLYRHGNFFRVDSDDELDVRAIEEYEPKGVNYTTDAEEAIEAVDSDHAALAFLVRAPSVKTVMAFARRGETMPPKTTYFFPKLASGLLLHPV